MVKPAPTYQRLAQSRFGLAGVGSLWVAADHLVWVTNTFSVEQYRRWYFKDVQAIISRRTVRRLVVNLVVGGGGLMLTLGAIACIAGAQSASAGDHEAFIAFAVIAGVLALGCWIVVLINSLLGPGCAVHIQTPLGTDKLNIPCRQRGFERLLARIQPTIEAIQAQPPAGETSAGVAEIVP
jgi:hypothetical protein